MRSVLICHAEADFDRIGLASWLASFSDLAGIIVLREPAGRGWLRVKKEIQRSGWLGFLDVVVFRLQYRLLRAAKDRKWEADETERLRLKYPCDFTTIPVLEAASPNSPEAEAFLRRCQADFVLARCKVLLKKQIFDIPTHGTYVLHPGMCPEYRNAHGAFWALANGEPEKVAVTLLRIDAGVDTGPVFGYFTYAFDIRRESHIVIQLRCVTENLDAIRSGFEAIVAGTAVRIDTAGRRGAVWGQPWWSRSLGIRRLAARRADGEGK